MTAMPPARIARTMTSHLWGTAQTCRAIAPGIFKAQTASHGGYLALLAQCNLPGEFVDACEQAGLVETLGVVMARRSTFASTAQMHSREAIVRWLAGNRARGLLTARYDIAVFEEDCDWSALALVCPVVGHEETAQRILTDYDHLTPFRYLCHEVVT